MTDLAPFGQQFAEFVLRDCNPTPAQVNVLARASTGEVQKLRLPYGKGKVDWLAICDQLKDIKTASKIVSPVPKGKLRVNAPVFVPMSPSPVPSAASSAATSPMLPETKENKGKPAEKKSDIKPLYDINELEPYLKYSDEILKMLDHDKGICTVIGETGSGKTTGVTATLAKARGVPTDKNAGQSFISIPTQKGAIMMYEFLKNKAPIGLCLRGRVERGYFHTKVATTGWVLNWLIHNWKLKSLNNSIFVLDEAHHSGWETTALAILLEYLKRTRYPQLKVIVATATPNIQFLRHLTDDVKSVPELKIGADRSHVKVEHVQAKNDITKGNSMNEAFLIEMATKFVAAVQSYHRKYGYHCNGIVMLPGLEEVDFVYSQLERELKKQRLNDLFVLQPATSQVDSQEIQTTLKDAKANDQFVILIATNAMQNSITIENTGLLFDCGYRKHPVWDFFKVQSLRLERESNADEEQATGRLRRGADKRPGEASIFMDEEANPEHIDSEFYSMPMHMFLLNLISAGLTPEHVLERICKWHATVRIGAQMTLHELEEIGALETKEEKRAIKKLGQDMAWINKDPKTSEFLAQVFRDHLDEPDVMFWAVLLAVWLGFNAKPILVIPKVYQKTAEAIAEQEKAKACFVKMPGNDIAHKIMWVLQEAYKFEDTHDGHQQLRAWCRDHYVSYAALNMIFKEHAQLIDDISAHELKMPDHPTQPFDKVLPTMISLLVKTFGICSRKSDTRDLYWLSGEETFSMCSRLGKIDRWESPLLERGAMPNWLLCCSVRKAGDDNHFFTKNITLSPFEKALLAQGLTPSYFVQKRREMNNHSFLGQFNDIQLTGFDSDDDEEDEKEVEETETKREKKRDLEAKDAVKVAVESKTKDAIKKYLEEEARKEEEEKLKEQAETEEEKELEPLPVARPKPRTMAWEDVEDSEHEDEGEDEGEEEEEEERDEEEEENQLQILQLAQNRRGRF